MNQYTYSTSPLEDSRCGEAGFTGLGGGPPPGRGGGPDPAGRGGGPPVLVGDMAGLGGPPTGPPPARGGTPMVGFVPGMTGCGFALVATGGFGAAAEGRAAAGLTGFGGAEVLTSSTISASRSSKFDAAATGGFAAGLGGGPPPGRAGGPFAPELIGFADGALPVVLGPEGEDFVGWVDPKLMFPAMNEGTRERP